MLARFAFAAWFSALLVSFAAAQTTPRVAPGAEAHVKIEAKVVPIADKFFERDRVNPSRRTVVPGGWNRQQERLIGYGSPAVIRIPYVHQAFRNFGYRRSSEPFHIRTTTAIVDKGEKPGGNEATTQAQRRAVATMRQFNDLYEHEKFAEAERCLLKALERDPDEPMAKAALTLARFRLHEKKLPAVLKPDKPSSNCDPKTIIREEKQEKKLPAGEQNFIEQYYKRFFNE